MAEETNGADGIRCVVCGDVVIGPARPCERCETPHHPECWEYNEGCAVYGCGGALVLVQAEIEERLAAEAATLLEEPLPATLTQRAVLRVRDMSPDRWRTRGFQLIFLGLWVMALVSKLTGARSAVLLLGALPLSGLYMMLFSELLPEHVRFLTQDALPVEAVEETPLKQLEARLGADPKNVFLLDMVGFGYFAEGRFEEALECYELLLSLQPSERQARYRRARCLQKLKRDQEARGAFEELLELPEDDRLRQQASWWLGVLKK